MTRINDRGVLSRVAIALLASTGILASAAIPMAVNAQEKKAEAKKAETKPQEKKAEAKPQEKKAETKPQEKKAETKPAPPSSTRQARYGSSTCR